MAGRRRLGCAALVAALACSATAARGQQPTGLVCCSAVAFDDPYAGGAPVTGGYYATVDLTQAQIVVTGLNNPDWCSDPTYRNPQMPAENWAQSGGYRARLYVNANFFDPARIGYQYRCTTALGLAVSDKVVVASQEPGPNNNHTDALVFFTAAEAKQRNRYAVIASDAYAQYRAAIQNAVSGFWLLQEGTYREPSTDPNDRRPRTAAGLSADGTTLYLVSINAGDDYGSGTTLHGLADYLKGLGAHDALSLDGGGSAQLYFHDPATGTTYRTSPSQDCPPPSGGSAKCYRPIPIFLGVR